MWSLIIFSSLLWCALGQGGFYKVIAPRVVRPNSEYHTAVSVEGTSAPSTINVTLLGVSDNGRPYSTQETIYVQPYTTRIARLEVRDIDPGNYRLSVRGTGGVQFQKSASLQYARKSYSVFIQTDKAVYKPGHKILFRAIVLNAHLKPTAEVTNEPLNIHISDGDGNKVKEWQNVIASKGVFTSELQLGKSLVLGNWNISVTIHGQIFNKTFEVAEYILPKFLINIQAPKHMTFKENILIAHIQSLYNYGKKVRGNATVTVYPTIYSGVIQPIFQNPIRKVVPIDGSATVEFDIANELKLSDEYERTVIIDVTIEEALTERRQNNSMEIHLHKYNYKMEIVKTADYYKPGLKYTAYIKVSNHDNTPIPKDKKNVNVRYGYSRLNEVYKEEMHMLDQNGVIKLEFYPPKNSTNETALRIEAEYMDLKERMSPVPAAISETNTYLQASLAIDKNPVVNQGVDIIVNCTEQMKYINYQVFGRGDVLLAHTFQTDYRKQFKFHFTVTYDMVPVAHLLINYVRNDGQAVADSLDIEVDGLVQNFIDIQLNTVETQPESDIDLTVSSQPNSYVGLLAVDQQVNNLRSGYDVTQQIVSDELKRYDVADLSPYSTVMKDARSHFFWKPGSSNTQDMFHDSGALVLTNALVSDYRPSLEDVYLRPVSYGSSTVKPDRGAGLAFHTITRPPLAGPYAFSRIPRPVWDKPKVHLTHDLADTWLFTNFSLNAAGKTSIGRKIPKSLTTWVVTGFSLDPLFGLGLLRSTPKKIKVSKTFVVSMDLPHLIQRQETLAVPVVIYNNQNKEITADVTLHNQDQKFKFVDMLNEGNGSNKIEFYRKKKIVVKQNSGASVSFMITPFKLGEIELKVTASALGLQDSISKNLLVTAEGETQYFTKSLLVDLRKSSSFKGNISFELPKNVIPGSESIQVSAIGDLLWPAITNLDNLIRLPTGCGEQNLIHFIPNLIILNYLRNTGQLSPTLLGEAINNLETAYQQQLMYKRPDGSFSAFGKRDTNSSVWITAYVALAFNQAKPFIYVDNSIIGTALEWLDDKQGNDGSFNEIGTIIHAEMQNKDESLALTAFTLIAFIENQQTFQMYRNTVNKGLDYIARGLKEGNSIHTIAICTYILHLANHPSKQSAFNILDSRAQVSNNSKWWAEPVSKTEESNPWNKLPKSLDIEATSYALLAFLEQNLIEDALPVVNWLIQQQNGLGGFTSSQDTVMGMIALYKMVLKLSGSSKVDIEFAHKQGRDRFTINQNNAMIDQRMTIDKDIRELNITATGQGLALFRVIYQYNVNVTGPWPMFILDPQVDKNSNQHHLQLSICTSFVSKNLTATVESNMAVMEVSLPSGFTADIDSLPSLEVSQNVQKVETKNGDTTVVLYFNNLTVNEYCPTVSAFRTHKVAKQKAVPVIVYDYYDSSRRARIFYKMKTTTLCDICEEEDCSSKCDLGDVQQPQASREGGGAASITSSWICLVVVVLALKYSNRE